MQGKLHQYHLIEELARKYSHVTYLASPLDDPGRPVVLIALDPSLSSAFPRECKDFLQKAQRIQALRHPHLLPLLNSGIEEEQPFAVREYLPNGSLRSRLQNISPDHLELNEALTLVSQVGQVLAYAHEHHIFHGNVKPENILFDTHGQVFLTDFHLMSRKDALIRDQTTEEYAFCYMAPEQFAGSITEKSDQYALGCLAYELITGHVPFTAQTLASMMGHQNSSSPRSLSERITDLPPSLEAAVLKTLTKDPAERFSDLSLFLEVIQSILFLTPAFPLGPFATSRKQRTISRRTRRRQKAQMFVSSLHEVAILEVPEAIMPFHTEQSLVEPMGAPVAIETSVETLLKLEDQNSRQALTRQLPEEQVDDQWLNDLFEEQERQDLSATGSVSLEQEPCEDGVEKKQEIIVSLLNERKKYLRRQTQHRRRTLLGSVLLCLVFIASGTYAASSLLRRSEPDGLVRPTQVVKEVLIPVQRDIPPTQPAGLGQPANAQSTPRINTMGIVIPTPRVNLAISTPDANSYPPYTGQLILDDPLSDNSRGYGWDDYPPSSASYSASCQFMNGAYHAAVQADFIQSCYSTLQESNFAFEVQMQIIQGVCGGLMVRSEANNGQTGYYLQICYDGSYQFDIYGTPSGNYQLRSGSNAAIITGLGSSNLIAIVANGNMFDLYVNHQEITSMQDSAYSQGVFGVCAGFKSDVAYTNARVWAL